MQHVGAGVSAVAVAAAAAAAAHNAHAVQAATEAMLAAGFGHFDAGAGEDGLDDDGEDDAVDENGMPLPHHHHPPSLASQLALATQHTATAASSLAALPSQAFFASLRVGEGVDALDLIGQPQWRHAVVLASRPAERTFLLRWAGWDAKWDEQVHSLRIAPAHSKVLGDTGPEDSAEKNMVAVLGAEWSALRNQWPTLLADTRVEIEGTPPWSILQQPQQQRQRPYEHATMTTSPPPPRHRGPPSAAASHALLPPRFAASATPPSHAHAPLVQRGGAVEFGSLDDDEEDDESYDFGSGSNNGFPFIGSSASAIAASTQSHTPPPPPRRRRNGVVQHAHECMLRVRCPRIFKYERDARALMQQLEAASSASAQASPSQQDLQQQHSRNASLRGRKGILEFKADEDDFDNGSNLSSPLGTLQGSRTAPASSVSAALSASAASAADGNGTGKSQKAALGGSLKLPLNKAGRQSMPPSSHMRMEQPSVMVGSALTSAVGSPPPSARLAKSASTTTARSASSTTGSQTARSLSRQSSVSSLSSSPVATASKSAAARKSAGTVSSPSTVLTRSGSTPSSAPNSAQRRLFSGAAAAASPVARGSLQQQPSGSPSRSTSAASSRARTPNVSAPATPRLRPSGVSASPRSSPLSAKHAAAEALQLSSPSSVRGSPPKRAAVRPTSAAAASPNGQLKRRSAGPAASSHVSTAGRNSVSSSPPAFSARATASPSPLLAHSPSLSPSPQQQLPTSSEASSDAGNDDGDDEEHGTEEADVDADGGVEEEEHVSLKVLSASPSISAAALASPSAILFPKAASSTPLEEECKEQPAVSVPAGSSPARSSPAPAANAVPPMKLLVLPLSSSKALAAFLEYVYSDSITATALGQKPTSTARPQRPPPTSSAQQLRRNLRRELALDDDEDDGWSNDEDAAATGPVPTQPAASSADAKMSVLDLLELACLASALHDGRLMCLASLHLQRSLSASNIMPLLEVLDRVGALEHRVKADRVRQSALSVHVNGSLAPIKHEPKNGNGSPSSAATTFAAGCVPTGPIPSLMLAPDTASNFLRTGSLSLCGPSSHDLDLLSRVVLDFLLLNWHEVFASGDNMRALHSMPFATFSLLVSLKNAGNAATAVAADNTMQAGGGGGAGVASEAAGEDQAQDGLVMPRPYQFANPLEKATFAQAQVNAALIAAGIQPSPAHNLFAQAHLLGGGLGLTSAASAASAGVVGLPGSAAHKELVQLIASPALALPSAGLLRAMKALFDSRSERSCDVKLLIEEDEKQVQEQDAGSQRVPFPPRERKVVATLWAHKIVLAWGSEYFRTYFGAGRLAAGGDAGFNGGGWDRLREEHDGVSVVRFPSSGFTAASLHAILRFIYTSDARSGMDFGTALHVLNAHPNAFFGLREYPASTSSASSGLATNYTPPANFHCDLEKACVNLLHTALNAGNAGAPVASGGASMSLLAPSAVQVMQLIQSAYQYGPSTRALFERGCALLDWSHLHAMMQAVQAQQHKQHHLPAQSPPKHAAHNPVVAARGPSSRGTLAAAFYNDDDDDAAAYIAEDKAALAAAALVAADALSDSELDDEEQLMLLQQQGLPSALSASASLAPTTSRASASACASAGSIERGTLAGALDMDFIAAVIAEKARAVAVAAAAGMQPKVAR